MTEPRKNSVFAVIESHRSYPRRRIAHPQTGFELAVNFAPRGQEFHRLLFACALDEQLNFVAAARLNGGGDIIVSADGRTVYL